MVESESHLTGYQRPPMQFVRPSNPPQVFSDSSAVKTGGLYVVNPKQYAPLAGTSSSTRTLPSTTSGYNHDYATPQTPPVSCVMCMLCMCAHTYMCILKAVISILYR